MADEIAKQFVQYYYATFDQNRASLAPLYRPNSALTWEKDQFKGHEAIVEKLTSLPSGVVHQVSTLDAQPSNETVASILVMVTGALVIDDNQPMQFSQTFHLLPDGGSYYIFNDIFRLNLG
ncbi:Nuclear transport factor 2 [Tulasnella sp. JGI-2019a]|nr:Nuclear transport factor 2 [Tulasnella sp. JGI-2019a]KAG8994208.1 Nuclear transport factor 2 [Tulasnella sp. JGI-2019a]